ncbi:hypothetical protein UFOVP662_40 [uncultured Caudovirales phage]|uniref:HNHc domain containing protein n=1 Tax=uncultured Caudovirales phage TaxID=2100421 RepID=A0A6J5NE64_9CAUD|nr:hypothetical protein UFOVP662_40 [uncultured Caudovirales phage]CAB4181445.1 hypothetical protein UFOVP1067_40 [uncultured Caudovirales phage]
MLTLTKKQLYRREYYLKNKDKANEQSRLRYINNRDDLLQYQKEYRSSNREKVNAATVNKRKNRLLTAIELLGGKCNNCNGKFEPCVYDFHHIKPEEKEFTIGENMLISKERFFKEVSKCILLCANCHRMEHHKNV